MTAILRALPFAVLMAPTPGCSAWKTQWAFDRIVVNETTQTRASSLIPDPVKMTTVSLVHYTESKNPPGTEALVCVLDAHGQVVGKFAVRTRRENWGLARKETASVRIEVAPSAEKPNPDAGPVHQLRTYLAKVRRKQGDYVKDQGHALACAGILRILETLPGVTTSAADRQQFADTLQLIPPNGTLTCTITDRQTYDFDFQASSARRARVTFEAQ